MAEDFQVKITADLDTDFGRSQKKILRKTYKKRLANVLDDMI